MSLTLALNNAISGLTVSQQALSTTSHNIANVNTEGYSRQIVQQSSRIVDGIGNGAQINDIVRKVDVYLQRAIRAETSTVGFSDTISDYYDRLQIYMGEPGSENSLDEYVEDFFNALQSLAETPNFTSFQATAVDTAEVLALQISNLAYAIEDLRYQADQDIDKIAEFINGEIAHLRDINVAINRADAIGISKASLFDDRDNTLKTISEYMDIDIYMEENGRVNVFTGSGINLVDENIYELRYTPAISVDSFINDSPLSPLELHILNDDGETIATRDIFSEGTDYDITSELNSGILEALHQLRDVLLPDMMSQLDVFSAQLRDTINVIHNDGSGFPGADELTGTRLVSANAAYDWSGTVRIAVLNEDGTPARSTYADETYTGYRPLDLDFEFLDSGFGAGVPTVQTIIDEINNHFNAPPVKAVVNNLNNIQLVSDNSRLPNAAPSTFTFDFDLENLSATDADFWVTNVTVLDDTGANITNVTDTVPRVTVDPVNTYSFQNGTNLMTINTSVPHGFQEGDIIYLEDPGALPAFLPLSGVPASDLVGYFVIESVTNSTSFVVQIPTVAGATATEGGYGTLDALPEWHTVAAGDKERSRDNGLITADLSLNQTSAYYDITVAAGVYANDDDVVDTVSLTYRVYNNQVNLLNDRYDISNLSGTGKMLFPTTPHQYIIATMVDEDGNELPKTNGTYGEQQGYLKLVANGIGDESYTISIDEMNSSQLGQLSQAQVIPGTERGFSHFFELNNFFSSNVPTTTGDTVAGSAINLQVEQRLREDPSLITTGDLQRSLQSADPDDLPIYTYERYESDSSVAQRMAGLMSDRVAFAAAGGLPDSQLSFVQYAGEFLGYQASRAASYEKTLTDSETLLSGFQTRSDEFSGVNLDEELANTIIFQNAYAASARIITVTDELFNELLAAF